MCDGGFSYSVAYTTFAISSNQSASCAGTLTIDSYSIPGYTMCCWYPVWGGSKCCKWGWDVDCSWKKFIKWDQSCWTTPSIEIWPTTTITGSTSMSTTMTWAQTISYTTDGPSSGETTSLTINSLIFSINIDGVAASWNIANGGIQCQADQDGNFSATINLDTISSSYDGIGYTWNNSLLLCPKPSDGAAWLNVTATLSFSYDGVTAGGTLVMPITEA